jgi:very-short-patch-repair endonuclease
MRTPPINRRIFRSANAHKTTTAPDPRTREAETPVERARILRADATDAERILWASLRTLKERGFHFRRQAPIGPYIADFACKKARLVIELDGGQHSQAAAQAYDETRTRFMSGRGYRVVRFWNDDVFRNRDGVVDAILRALSAAPPDPRSARIDLPASGEVKSSGKVK